MRECGPFWICVLWKVCLRQMRWKKRNVQPKLMININKRIILFFNQVFAIEIEQAFIFNLRCFFFKNPYLSSNSLCYSKSFSSALLKLCKQYENTSMSSFVKAKYLNKNQLYWGYRRKLLAFTCFRIYFLSGE